MEKTTNQLTSILKNTDPDKLGEFLDKYSGDIITDVHPFASFMRQAIKEKGLRQQDVFLDADLSDGYGYKLISEEKHTRTRDTVLRLCFASRLTFDETQKALMLYGMSPLYPRISRDALFIVAISQGMHNVHAVNQLLRAHSEAELKPIGSEE